MLDQRLQGSVSVARGILDLSADLAERADVSPIDAKLSALAR
jgi:hypothetical protein